MREKNSWANKHALNVSWVEKSSCFDEFGNFGGYQHDFFLKIQTEMK
jgi:hypothetical protein